MGGKDNRRRGAGRALFSAQPGATIVLAGEGGRNPLPLALATTSPVGRPYRGVAGRSPAEGVGRDAQRLELRGRLPPLNLFWLP